MIIVPPAAITPASPTVVSYDNVVPADASRAEKKNESDTVDNIELPKARRIFLSDMKRISGSLSQRTGYAPKGMWLSENGYHEEARHYLQQAAKEDPTSPRIWLNLYDNEASLGHPTEVLMVLRPRRLTLTCHRALRCRLCDIYGMRPY